MYIVGGQERGGRKKKKKEAHTSQDVISSFLYAA